MIAGVAALAAAPLGSGGARAQRVERYDNESPRLLLKPSFAPTRWGVTQPRWREAARKRRYKRLEARRRRNNHDAR